MGIVVGGAAAVGDWLWKIIERVNRLLGLGRCVETTPKIS